MANEKASYKDASMGEKGRTFVSGNPTFITLNLDCPSSSKLSSDCSLPSYLCVTVWSPTIASAHLNKIFLQD
jgi:hypothetical protein